MDLREEKLLVEQAKKNPDAFGALYDLHYSKIFNYILKRVANVELAQDVTSETFIKALKNIWRFRWKNVSFSAWLYRIASNEIANSFRKKKNAIPLELASEPVDCANSALEDVIVAQDELKKHCDFLFFQEKISKLERKYQEVITLRFFEKKQIKEISEILGKREGTIKSLIHRAVKKLSVLMPPKDS